MTLRRFNTAVPSTKNIFPFLKIKKTKTRKKNGIKVLNFEWPSILKKHEDSYSLVLTWFLPSCQVSLFPRPTLAIVLVSLFYRSDVQNKRYTISGRHELDKTLITVDKNALWKILTLHPTGAAQSVNWPPLPEVFFPSQETVQNQFSLKKAH